MIKVEVSTHSGDTDIIEIESYCAKDLNEERNDNDIQSILIGENSYSRIDLKNVKIVDK